MPSAITMPATAAAAAAAARLEARVDADQHQTVGSAAKIQGRTLSGCVVAAVRDGCAARHRAVRARPGCWPTRSEAWRMAQKGHAPRAVFIQITVPACRSRLR